MNIVCYNNSCKAENPEHATWCLKCNTLLTLIKRYQVQKFIAQGAMGNVYLAEDLKNQQKVVVKVLKAGSPERFAEEARLGKRAWEKNAKHLVHVLDELDVAGRKFIVQNYIEGETLLYLLKNENELILPFSRKLSIAANYASALEEMRSMEIVHRDLKPENTMVGPDDHITILDFGLAKDDFSLTLTMQGQVMGTYFYIAPESLESSHNADFSADIFSLGVILYEIFHGKIPHDFSLLDRYYQTPEFMPKLRALKCNSRIYYIFPGAPNEIKKLLTELITKCLHPEPGKRCASIFISKTLAKCIKYYDEFISQKIQELPENHEDLLRRLQEIPYIGKTYPKSNRELTSCIQSFVKLQSKQNDLKEQESELNKAITDLKKKQKEQESKEQRLQQQLAEQQKMHEELQKKLTTMDKEAQRREEENSKHSCDLISIEDLKTWLQDPTYWEGNTICKAAYHGYIRDGKPHGQGRCEFFYGGKLQFIYKRKNLIYEGDWTSGIPNGKGVFLWINGDRYEGDVKNGKREGKGLMIYQNKSEYFGEWESNVRNGWGNFTWGELDAKKAGDKYTGQFRNDAMTGHGTLLFSNGEKYIGEFQSGSCTGYGTYFWTNGEKYVGEFREGVRTGQGMYSWPSGDEYVGHFQDGKRTGYGTHTSKGERYIGEFRDGIKTGKGTLIWANGNIYEGEFRDDTANGKGTFTWAVGNKYIGEFRDGEKNGDGTFIWANGDKYEGKFKDDQKNGQGTFMWTNGDIFIGKFKNDEKSGQGTFMWANGDKYEGKFKDDSANGPGNFMWANGDVFVGKFKDGKKQGSGVIYNADKTIKTKGIWENDILVR